MALISATFEDIFEDVIDYYKSMNLYIVSAQDNVRYYGNFPGLDHPLAVNISASPTQTSGSYTALEIISRGLIKGITDFFTSGTEVSAFGFTIVENGISAINSKIGINYNSLNLEITSAGQLSVVSIPTFQTINLIGSNLNNGQIVILSGGKLVTSAIHFPDSTGTNDHSQLINLDRDDHGQYLHLFPNSDTRNIIQLSADVKPFTIVEYSSQTKEVIQVLDSNLNKIFVVSANGDLATQGHLIVSGAGKNLIFSDGNDHQITTPSGLTVHSFNQVFETTSTGMIFKPGLTRTFEIQYLSVSAVDQLIVGPSSVRINSLSGAGDRYVVADSFGNLRATSAIGGSVSGSALGTINRIAKFLTSAAVGNSLMIESGGMISVDGDFKVGTGSSSTSIWINGANQQNRSLTFQTNGTDKWNLRANTDNDVSANNGSNFELNSYDVSGSFLDNPIFIYRNLNSPILLKRNIVVTSAATISGNINIRGNQYFYGQSNSILFPDGGSYVLSATGYMTVRSLFGMNIQTDTDNIYFRPYSLNTLTLAGNSISAFNQYELTPNSLRVNYLSGASNRNLYVDSFGNFLAGTAISNLANVTGGIPNYYALFSNSNTITSGSFYEQSWGNVQLIANRSTESTSLEIYNTGIGVFTDSYLNIKTGGAGNSRASINLITNVGSGIDTTWSITQLNSTSGFYIAYGFNLNVPALYIGPDKQVKIFNGLVTYGNLSATGTVNVNSLSGATTRLLGVDSTGNLTVVGSVSANVSGTINTHAKFVTPISVGDSLISESGTSILNAGNVYSTLTGGGFWIDSLGSFNYGMFKSGSSLAFRSGNGSINRITVLSGGETIFAGYVGVSGTVQLRSFVSQGTSSPGTGIAYNLIGDIGYTTLGQVGIASQSTFNSNAAQFGAAFYSLPNVKDQSFLMGSLIGFYADDAIKGTNATVTTQYGLYVASQTKGITNYSIYTNNGLVRFGDAVSMISTLSVTSTATFGNKIIVNDEGLVLNRGVGSGYITFQNGSSIDTWSLQRDNGDGALELYSSSTATGTSAIFRIQKNFNGTPALTVYTDTGNVLLGSALNVSGASNFASTFKLANFSGSTTRVLGIDSNGFVTPLLVNSSYLSGSGTNNIVPKFTGTNSLGNSTITDFGSSTVVTINNDFNVSGDGIIGSTLQVNQTLGVGIAPDTSFGLYVNSTLLQGSDQYGIVSTPTFTSAADTSVTGYYVKLLTLNSSVVIPNAYGYYVAQANVSESPGTFTNLYGLRVSDITRGSTSNFAIKTGLGLVDLGDRLNVSGTSFFKSFIGQGISPSSSYGYRLQGDLSFTGSLQAGIASIPTFNSQAVGTGISFYSQPNIKNQFFTITDLIGFYADNSTKGTSATISNQYGLYVASQTNGQNNYAIFTNSGLVSFFDVVFARSRFNVSGASSFNSTASYVGSQAAAFNAGNGYFYSPATGINQVVLNSIGANYGFISNSSSNTWNLGYGTNPVVLGTSVLSWNSSGLVTIAGSLVVNSSASFQSGLVRTTPFTVNDTSTDRGYLVIGPSAGVQLQIDTDDIQIMNGNSAGTLLDINYGGGNVGIGRGSSGSLIVAPTSSPVGRLDVQSTGAGGNGVIASFGNSSNASFPAYIYFSQTNTINAGYNVNGAANLYINYMGYQNGTTQVRNLGIADGKNNVYVYFNGSSKGIVIKDSADGVSPIGKLDVQAADGNGVIASFGDSTASSRAGYIYISQTNTINAGYGQDVDGTEIWLNYAGYNNSNTRYRNLSIGDGRTTRWVWFDGANKRIVLNNGTTNVGSAKLQVNDKIWCADGIYNDSSVSTAFYSVQATSTDYFQANDGNKVRIRFHYGPPGSGYNYFHAGLAVGDNSPTPASNTILHGKPSSDSCYIVLDKDSSSYESGIQFNDNGTSKWYFYLDNNTNHYLQIAASSLTGENDNTPRVRFSNLTKDIWLAGSGGNIRIGDVNGPNYKLDIVENSGYTAMSLAAYGGGLGPNLLLRHARGTYSSPSNLDVNNDAIGFITFQNYYNNQWNDGAQILAVPRGGPQTSLDFQVRNAANVKVEPFGIFHNQVNSYVKHVMNDVLELSLGTIVPLSKISTNTVLDYTYHYISVEGVCTITLPAANTGRYVYHFTRQKSFAGSAAIATAGSDAIYLNGSSFGTVSLSTGTAFALVSDGVSSWYVFEWHA